MLFCMLLIRLLVLSIINWKKFSMLLLYNNKKFTKWKDKNVSFMMRVIQIFWGWITHLLIVQIMRFCDLEILLIHVSRKITFFLLANLLRHSRSKLQKNACNACLLKVLFSFYRLQRRPHCRDRLSRHFPSSHPRFGAVFGLRNKISEKVRECFF